MRSSPTRNVISSTPSGRIELWDCCLSDAKER
jgi:hypothetical protein